MTKNHRDPKANSDIFVFSQLKHPSLRKAITEQIHFAIIAGTLKPGQRITEQLICQQLGVSRTSVREAFQEMRAMGVLTENRRKTYISAGPGPDEIRDTFALRGLCEGLAAESARTRLSDKDFEALEGLVKGMEAASRQRDPEAFQKADLAFHDLIWRANTKRYLHKVLSTIVGSYHYFLMGMLRTSPRAKWLQMTQLHRSQLKDLRRLSGPKLRTRIQKHYENVGKLFLRLYSEHEHPQ